MSGFCALISKNDDLQGGSLLMRRLINPITYMGIGKTDIHVSKNIGLAVYDQYESKPERYLFENDNVLVACDAQIYNYKQLLLGKINNQFREAELIASLYDKKGKDWWRDIDGVFGVFIWDKKEHIGWVFTDHIGIKPIVYYEDKEQIVIASRIRSIRALPGFKSALNNQAIFNYFSMEMIPTPDTIFDSIIKLEGGHFIKIQNKKLHIKQFWQVDYSEQKVSDFNQIIAKIYSLTRQAVADTTNYRGNVEKVGSFLSGGTDSSAIVGLIDELYPGQAKSFSIGFNEHGYDEMYYARIAAKKFKALHKEYYVTPDDIFNSLPKIIISFDEPFANSSVIPAYFCSILGKENGVDVLLGGDGGDEIFGGNVRYHNNFTNFTKYPQWLLELMWPVIKNIPKWARFSVVDKIYNHIGRALGPLEDKICAYNFLNYYSPKDIFSEDFLNRKSYLLPQEIVKSYIDRLKSNEPLERFLFNDLKLTIMDNDIRKVNWMTELANINVRYPLLNIKLIEYAALIPPELKVHNGKLRYIFKKAFENLLPEEILIKHKHGFGLPVVPWMLKNTKLKKLLLDILFDRKTTQRGIFKSSFINAIYHNTVNDKTTFHGTSLYYISILELWLREHFDQEPNS